jgi:hypothetical protein
MAIVVATGVEVELSCGTVYQNCRKIMEWTRLEAGSLEYKFYAPGVGVVMEQKLDGSVPIERLGEFDTGPQSLADFSAAVFSNPTQITNTFVPWTPGSKHTFQKETEDGTEEIIVEVLAGTRLVNGVECVVVRDRVFLDGVLIEDTHDWYAQDDAGNVWYMGEDVINYEFDEQGNVIGTNNEGAWEAGVDGAEPGILMWADPLVGISYYQEFYEDEAEDMGTIVATGVTVELSSGTVYPNCLKTLEWTRLDPAALEFKYFAPGIGLVLEATADGAETAELVTIE